MIRIFKYLMVFLFAPQVVFACQQCFGANVNTATTQGIGFAMLALLIFTGFVSSGIVMFFVNMNKRSKILSQGSVDHDAPILEAPNPDVLDRLLDKNNAEGFISLKRQEKEIL